MSAGIMSDESKVNLLTSRLGNSPVSGGNLYAALFTTGFVPTRTLAYGSATPYEVAFTGYARQVVGSWTTPALTSGHKALAQAAPVTFGPNTSGSPSPSIVGWALIDNANAKLVFVADFDSPFTIADGETFSMVPVWTDTGDLP